METESGETFAIKTINKSKVPRLELLKREIDILRTVDHPNIIRLEDVYEDEHSLHLVTELCTGGELFDCIIAKTESEEGRYSERDAAKIVHKILGAIEYIHNEHNICHRDLKPENFIFKTKEDQSELKIIDFGLSRFEDSSEAMTTRVGTPYYIAPEVLLKKYNKACDLWSIGVITFILLCGYPPFHGNNDAEIFRSVQRVEYRFLSPEWDDVSNEAKDLIQKLIVKDPTQRLTAGQALVHPWFEKNVGNEDEGHLRKVFDALDLDGNGEVTVDELQQVILSEGMVGVQGDLLELLQGADMDGNQTLDYREFLAATMEKGVFLRRDNLRKAFDHFDFEKKGHISAADLMQVLGSEERAQKILRDIDSNGDGRIDFEEFSEMMKQL